MSDYNHPMISPLAWRGAWVRSRSGPTRGGSSVLIEKWHRVGGTGERIEIVCRAHAIRGLLWPSGGARLEVARPYDANELPGEVCYRCLTRTADRETREVEVTVLDEVVLDDIATRVAAILLAKLPTPEPDHAAD